MLGRNVRTRVDAVRNALEPHRQQPRRLPDHRSRRRDPAGVSVLLGPGPDAGTFPGGAGIGNVDGQSYPYCVTGELGAGEQCLITVGRPETAPLGSAVYTSVNLSYADGAGPVSPSVHREVVGHGPLPP
jgi:hypothetical protein